MKLKMKRLLSLMIMLCMVIGIAPVQAFAEETINVTYDYESKEDVVKQFAKGVGIYEAAVESAPPADTKPGYVFHQWNLSADTPLENLSEPENPSRTKIIGDVTFVPHWYKYYDEIHFSFSGYELGADVKAGTLTDNIDGYAPHSMPQEIGGGNYAIVAAKDGKPDMTDPDTMFEFVEGKFEANTDYWLMVMIGGEGRTITGDIVVDAYSIDDYFLDSPDCVDKYHFAEGEAELAFFKLKPLEAEKKPEKESIVVKVELNGADEDKAEEANPNTGAYDFMGAAVALAVCSAVCGAALTLKRK